MWGGTACAVLRCCVGVGVRQSGALGLCRPGAAAVRAGLVCGFDLEIGSDGFFDLTGLPPIVGIRIPRRRR